MRLASRLQQDFLPRRLPAVGPVRFGVLYRPASWVSGDIYDVVRLDETHVGFYVADAVGHGMPAALMTMFIKEALQTKRIEDDAYEIIPPHEALAALNGDLCRQKLSMCEFCTAVYGVIDTRTLRVTLCRAGHPAPILLPAEGGARTLEYPGSLLGILEAAEYSSGELSLRRGDRLLLYSDGVEDILCGRGGEKTASLPDILAPLAERERREFLMALTDLVSGPSVEDDVTVLLLEVQ
jgi:sigma-B regulation protein RsbU (phosphoserine phosphatase)